MTGKKILIEIPPFNAIDVFDRYVEKYQSRQDEVKAHPMFNTIKDIVVVPPTRDTCIRYNTMLVKIYQLIESQKTVEDFFTLIQRHSDNIAKNTNIISINRKLVEAIQSDIFTRSEYYSIRLFMYQFMMEGCLRTTLCDLLYSIYNMISITIR